MYYEGEDLSYDSEEYARRHRPPEELENASGNDNHEIIQQSDQDGDPNKDLRMNVEEDNINENPSRNSRGNGDGI